MKCKSAHAKRKPKVFGDPVKFSAIAAIRHKLDLLELEELIVTSQLLRIRAQRQLLTCGLLAGEKERAK